MTATAYHAVLILLTSASMLAYEILLMRLLAIGQWYHLAYMVISMALLGYGAAGSLLFLFFDKIKKHPDRWLVFITGATAVSFPLAFSLSQKVGLDPLQLVWQPAQWAAMLLTYLLMGLPFLLGGAIVGIILTGSGEKVHRMYATDLLGAGSGALVIVPALFLGPPWHLLPAAGGLILLGGLLLALRMRPRKIGAITILCSACLLALIYFLLPPVPKIHHTKALPMTLSLPDARIEAKTAGPLGIVHVVGSSLLREAPGLSLNYGLSEEGGRLPAQKAIFIDGESSGTITHFTGNPHDIEFLDFTSMALPYHIRKPDRTLVVGADGGSGVLLALRNRTPEIIALEANRQIADLLLDPFMAFSGQVFSRPEVKLEVRDARQFLQATETRFDLIDLSLLDSPQTSAGGLHSAAESYLYTTEAFSIYLNRLSDSGILSVTRWLKLPPRDSLRVVATAVEALRKTSLPGEVKKHLLFIRSWRTSTILVSKSPFTREEIARAEKFCDNRSFDLAYFAGIHVDRANRYDVQPSPVYYEGAKALIEGANASTGSRNTLGGPASNDFIRRYVFDISPTTDDRPFFSHFFRWDTAPQLFHQLRREWLPMIDLGFVFILATLVQAAFASGLLILLPLACLRWRHGPPRHADPNPRLSDFLVTGVYFASIGVAFMFLEMALLPKYTLLLSHPVYSASLVLGALLVFAGCGSLSVRRFQSKNPWFSSISVGAIICWVVFQALVGDPVFRLAMGWSLGGRIVLALLFLSVLSFFLGFPFPSGLHVLTERHPGLVPWAWGINGCASVIGAVLGMCLAVSVGFRLLMFTACILYVVALLTYHFGLRKKPFLP
jgi:spermidine synthase